MKHWTINLTNKFIWRGGVTITDLEGNIICDVNMKNSEYQRNANLIVNASKMLETLELVMDYLGDKSTWKEGEEYLGFKIKQLIKEATTI